LTSENSKLSPNEKENQTKANYLQVVNKSLDSIISDPDSDSDLDSDFLAETKQWQVNYRYKSISV